MDKATDREIVVVGGDWNTQIRRDIDRRWENVLGVHGQEIGSRYGEELVNWCQDHGLLMASTHTWQQERGTWWQSEENTLIKCRIRKGGGWGYIPGPVTVAAYGV